MGVFTTYYSVEDEGIASDRLTFGTEILFRKDIGWFDGKGFIAGGVRVGVAQIDISIPGSPAVASSTSTFSGGPTIDFHYDLGSGFTTGAGLTYMINDTRPFWNLRHSLHYWF